MTYLVNNRFFASLEEAEQYCSENNIEKSKITQPKVVLRLYKK
jgi:hypothetical protein